MLDLNIKKQLIERAKQAAALAYSPYSKIQFGCAILTESGKTVTGNNVENSSYGATVCAERVAIWKAVSEGDRKFQLFVLYYDHPLGGEPITQCGMCRQVMAEFCNDVEIIVIQGNLEKSYHLADIFKMPFNAHTIDMINKK